MAELNILVSDSRLYKDYRYNSTTMRRGSSFGFSFVGNFFEWSFICKSYDLKYQVYIDGVSVFNGAVIPSNNVSSTFNYSKSLSQGFHYVMIYDRTTSISVTQTFYFKNLKILGDEVEFFNYTTICPRKSDISLIGSNIVLHQIKTAYDDVGCTCFDYGLNQNVNPLFQTNLDINKYGIYKYKYYYTDSFSYNVEVERLVIVGSFENDIENTTENIIKLLLNLTFEVQEIKKIIKTFNLLTDK